MQSTTTSQISITFLLADYNVLQELSKANEKEQTIYKLQVKNASNRQYLEFSTGNTNTTLGWIAQSVSRNYNQYLGYAGANRQDVINHLNKINSCMASYLDRKVITILKATNIEKMALLHKESEEIKKALNNSLSGIEVLKQTYKDDAETLQSLSAIESKINQIVSENIKHLHRVLCDRLVQLSKEKKKEIQAAENEINRLDKELFNNIHELQVNHKINP